MQSDVFAFCLAPQSLPSFCAAVGSSSVLDDNPLYLGDFSAYKLVIWLILIFGGGALSPVYVLSFEV